MPRYKSLQVSVTTEAPDLILSETLLSFAPGKSYICCCMVYLQ